MSALILPSRHYRQPQYPAALDKSHPLGAALEYVWLGSVPGGIDVSGRIVAPYTANTHQPSRHGVALTNTGATTSAVTLAESAKIKSFPFVVAGFGYANSSANNWNFAPFFAPSGNTLGIQLNSSTQIRLVLRFGFGTERQITVTTGTDTNNKLPILAIAQVFSDTDYRLYANGLQANGTLSPGTLSSIDTMFPPGHQINGGNWFCGYGRGKTLPDDIALEITRNPKLLWDVFQPVKQRIWVPSAGGASVTGTAAITEAGDTAAAAGNVAHLGTAAITEAADTPAAIGVVEHVGAAAITEVGDTPEAIGTVGTAGITGSAAILEAGDIVVGAGYVTHLGTSAITEAGDTPAAAGTVTSSGASADAVWAYEIEPGVSALQLMRMMSAVLLGKVSGAGTGTETFRDIGDTKNRVVSTVDTNGNRTAVTLDGS